jgi:type I restriction enzyme S subunit
MQPQLRFNEFNEDWDLNTIGSLGILRGGGTPPTQNKQYWSGNTPWISSSDLSDENINDIKISRKITNEAISNSATKIIPANSILIVSRVGVGKVAISTEDICTSQDFANLTLHSGSNRFFAYLIKNKTKNLLEFNQGTSIKGFVKSDLESYEIAFPSHEEQTKIASFLSVVDEKISQLTKKHELLTQYKKGVMQKIFSQELRFKADDGSDYPDWALITLSEIGTPFNGLTGKTAEDFGVGDFYVTYKQIFDSSKIDSSKFGFVTIKKNENQNQVKYGDLFFTTSSETPEEVGYCSVILENVDKVYLNSFCFGFRIKSFDVLLPEFARFLFFSPKMRESIILLAQGSTRYNISKTGFLKIKTPIPTIEEQTKIASFLSAIDDKIQNTQSQLDATKQYKQGLLQQMFV